MNPISAPNLPFRAIRLPGNPILSQETEGYDKELLGDNLNGPSLIRVPDWLPNPLGRYYLYFAHHGGNHIRLAYADSLAGPWKVHQRGVLYLDKTPCAGHIASPDLHIDEKERRLRMYYHGPTPLVEGDYDPVPPERRGLSGSQRSHVALSHDGLNFTHEEGPFAPPYLRAWKWKEHWYGIGMPPFLQRSKDGMTEWEAGPYLLDGTFDDSPEPMSVTQWKDGGPKIIRHSAVHVEGSTLHLFLSRIGDRPEHIWHATVDLAEDWQNWRARHAASLLQPEEAWEGTSAPLEPSRPGKIHGPVRQLRDPGIYVEEERIYLLYSVAGEAGIAIAELQR